MADDSLIPITENDAKDPNLLFRALRKIVLRVLALGGRISSLEKTPASPTFARIRDELQATGQAPLNITALPGLAAQPQLAGAPRVNPAPTGLVLQQYRDTQLLLVGSTSTGFALNAVVGGNPTVLYQLVSGLSTGTVSSTSTNLMTLDTTQTSTGDKTTSGVWLFASGSATVPGLAFSTSTTCGVYSTSTGTVSLAANGIQVMLGSSGAIRLPNTKITQYNGITTTAEGVPYIISRSVVSGVSTTVSAVTLYTTTTTGEYRLGYYISPTTTGTLTGVAFQAQWTDQLEVKNYIGSNISLAPAQVDQKYIHIHSASGAAIAYAASVGTSTVAPLGTFSIFVTLERLS